MKNRSLQLSGVVLLTILLRQTVPADVALPLDVIAISLGAVIGLGCLGAVIIIACIVVIRAIKKSNTPKNDA